MAGVFYFSVGSGADTQRAAASIDGLVLRGAGRGDSGLGNFDGDHDEPDQDDGEFRLGRGSVYAGAVS